MQKTTLLLVHILSILIVLTASPASASAQDGELSFDRLQSKFERLYRSLQRPRGMKEEDRPIIEELREQFARFNAQNANHAGALAGELQLSMWLEDHDRADGLFENLVQTAPDEPQYGLAWLDFLNQNDRTERAEEVFNWLLANTDDTTALRTSRARDLKRQSRYAQALDLLEEVSIDPAVNPEWQLLLAEVLYAENRISEAVAALELIPEDALTGKAGLRSQVNRLLREYREVAELWTQEEAHRSTEAEANDLPRVELETSRGRIVVELFEDSAPNTVANFISLVEDGFYDDTRFHSVDPEYMTSAGDPFTKPDGAGLPGTGGPGYRIADEWERENARRHFAGSLGMAHSGPDTAGSRFYIAHKPLRQLNRGYTVFGRVLEGLDVARQMEVNDRLIAARVLRKRDHEYAVETLRSLDELEENLPEFLRTQPSGQ